jgi:hypothetical protein
MLTYFLAAARLPLVGLGSARRVVGHRGIVVFLPKPLQELVTVGVNLVYWHKFRPVLAG